VRYYGVHVERCIVTPHDESLAVRTEGDSCDAVPMLKLVEAGARIQVSEDYSVVRRS
jgi:hypothetical protein